MSKQFWWGQYKKEKCKIPKLWPQAHNENYEKHEKFTVIIGTM